MKNTTIQIPTLCVHGKDLSFVDDMVAGGISDDGSCSSGDYFEDTKDYSKVPVTVEELNKFTEKYNLKTRFTDKDINI